MKTRNRLKSVSGIGHLRVSLVERASDISGLFSRQFVHEAAGIRAPPPRFIPRAPKRPDKLWPSAPRAFALPPTRLLSIINIYHSVYFSLLFGLLQTKPSCVTRGRLITLHALYLIYRRRRSSNKRSTSSRTEE